MFAASAYDAAHLFFTHAKVHRASGLPVPTIATAFEITANGPIHKVTGAKLREWIIREATAHRPDGYLFQKRAIKV